MIAKKIVNDALFRGEENQSKASFNLRTFYVKSYFQYRV